MTSLGIAALLRQQAPLADPPAPDSLRAVLDSVFAQAPYQWPPPETQSWVSRYWSALQQWLDDLQRNNPQGFRVFFWVLVGVLTLVLVHAMWVAWRTLRGASTSSASLPVEHAAVRDAAWYGAEATRLAAEGKYAEAMQADFLRLVLQLDRRKVVRFHPSKTPVEYTRDPGLSPGAREALRDLVRALYRYAFARVPCGATEFEAWRAGASADRYAAAH